MKEHFNAERKTITIGEGMTAQLTPRGAVGGAVTLAGKAFKKCLRSQRGFGETMVALVVDAHRLLVEEVRPIGQDALTGLGRSRDFRRDFDQSIRTYLKAGRSTCDSGFALLLLDVNNLTGINARHGYNLGDKVILHIADSLAESIRGTGGRAYRWRDEFAVILPMPAARDSTALIDSLRARISGTSIFGVVPSVGIGVVDLFGMGRRNSGFDEYTIRIFPTMASGEDRRGLNHQIGNGPVSVPLPWLDAAMQSAIENRDPSALSYTMSMLAYAGVCLDKCVGRK